MPVLERHIFLVLLLACGAARGQSNADYAAGPPAAYGPNANSLAVPSSQSPPEPSWASGVKTGSVDVARVPIRIVAASDTRERDADRADSRQAAAVQASRQQDPLPLEPPRRARDAAGRSSQPLSPTRALSTVATSLAVVLGVFILLVWFSRRSGRRGSAALPSDIVETLGRTPLNARQEMQLVRVGNKLLLLSVTASTAETLTEITDANEIERLTALCRHGQSDSLAASFRDVLSHVRAQPHSGYPVSAQRSPV